MNNNIELEKMFLTPEEIEFIKNTIIYPNIPNPETMKWIGWRQSIESAVLISKTASIEQINQYERIREIEVFLDLIGKNYPDDIMDMFRFLKETGDEKDIAAALNMTMQSISHDVEDAFAKKNAESVLEEEYLQDIEEPFIKDMIDQFVLENQEKQKYARIDSIIESTQFNSIDRGTLMSICSLLLKELENSKTNNKKTSLLMKTVDKKLLTYLMLKTLKETKLVVNNSYS